MQKMIYSLAKIADFNIEFECEHDAVERLCADYVTAEERRDLVLRVTSEDIALERKLADAEYSERYLEMIAAYRRLAEWLPYNDAFVLHSAVFDVDGTGVAFAAHSGTGKTTHLLLWQRLLGDRLTVVNGDKPIVRFFPDAPDTPIAFGTPWNGKEHLGENTRTPLKHICFIERAADNSAVPMQRDEAINLIFNQVYMPKNPAAVLNTMRLIDRLISSCKLWKISCNMQPAAADTAFSAIFGDGAR